jgi:subtilisin
VEAKTRIDNYFVMLVVLAVTAATVSLIGVSARGASAQTDPQPPPGQRSEIGESMDSERLLRVAEREGSVRVIVGLRSGFEPEGRLSRPEAAEQRRDIAGARADLRADLRTTGYRTVQQFETLPYVALELSPEALEAAWSSASVTTIRKDRAVAPALATSEPIIQVPEMWAAGYTGSGQTVAVLDSGVDSSHPFLSGKVVDEACYSLGSDCPDGSTSQTGAGAAAPCDYAEGCDHGTHVAGIVAGSSSGFSGVARNAGIMAIQITSKFTGWKCDNAPSDPCNLAYDSDQIAGLERVYELRNVHDFSSVNVSFGGGQYSGDCDAAFPDYKAAIDNLKSEGIATVYSSGNSMYTNALGAPACVSSAVSVGATDDTDEVYPLSNSSSSLDLLAPGVDIDSSVPGGGFESWDGTSMAAPHVAGAWALLKQQDPSATVNEVLAALKSTGKLVKDDRATNGVTKPRINVADASTALDPLANDDFADARALMGNQTVTVKGRNVGATRQPGEPDHILGRIQTGERSLWYRWTAPVSGRVELNTCTSTFDTALAVYTGGSLTSLSRKAADDNSCPSTQIFNGVGSKVALDVTGGTTYRIAVSGHSLSEQGNFTVASYYVAPTNDDFADAQQIGDGTHFTKGGHNVLATREEPSEPDHLPDVGGLVGEGSVWYAWTAPETGQVTINTCVSDFDTILNVYTGDSFDAPLNPTAANDDNCPTSYVFNPSGSKVTFDVTEGTSYKIAVSSYYAASDYRGSFTLGVDYARPANDAFANAQEIGGTAATADGTNIGATRQTGEPDHLPGSTLSSGEESVWYRWTAPSSGQVTLDTCASDFGALLALYTGGTVNALSPVPASSDACEGSGGRKLLFEAVAGTTYRIAVFSGFASGRGEFALDLDQDLTPPTVTSVRPRNGATGVGPAANVRADFSEPMKAITVNSDTVTLRKKGTNTRVLATVSYDPATGRVALNPDTNLKRGTSYIAKVSHQATDAAGNHLDQRLAIAGEQDKVWRFRVRA